MTVQTTGLRRPYEEQGFVVVRGLFPRELMALVTRGDGPSRSEG